jgi:hypothetical protein
MNKTSILLILVITLLSTSVLSKETDRSKRPHITSQHKGEMGYRILYIHNPLDKAVWVWVECQNVMSTQPIGLPARRFSEVNLKSNDPDVAVDDNTCYINHWQVQKNGNVP